MCSCLLPGIDINVRNAEFFCRQGIEGQVYPFHVIEINFRIFNIGPLNLAASMEDPIHHEYFNKTSDH